MPLQKRRMGRARIHSRRSAWMRRAANRPQSQACPNCGAIRISHTICGSCGFYKNEIVIEKSADTAAE